MIILYMFMSVCKLEVSYPVTQIALNRLFFSQESQSREDAFMGEAKGESYSMYELYYFRWPAFGAAKGPSLLRYYVSQ